MNRVKLFLVSMLLFVSTLSFAQLTTSSMSGQVTEASGDPIEFAAVVATHTPTNTQYYTTTDNNGNYRLQNMRPGGPYEFKVSFLGYKEIKFENISLALSANQVLDVKMETESFGLQEVTITAIGKNSNMSTDNAGAITNVSTKDIALMPMINRSINDLTRLTPQANGTSIGGGNFRQNFITVDGAAFNNAFGIGTNLPGNGSPISLDALDQISVSITPYDVRQSGFIGAAVNAVTKSGTNAFKGSAYTYLRDERLRGNKVGDEYFDKSPSAYKLYGLTLGGPIIKNKLFFFVNYETEKTVDPGPARVASTNGVVNGTTVARPTVGDMDMMSKYLKEKYNYETGPYQGYSFDSPGKKFLARIDWNINKNHKINLRYSYMDSKSPTYPSTSTSPFSNLYTGNRQSMDAMWYQNSGYFQEQNFSSLSGEWNSSYLDGKLNNTLRATYSYQDEPRSTGGNIEFPFVDILKDNRPYASFGTEIFSYGNLRQVATTNVTDELTFTLGKNNFTAGLSYEHNNTKNGFMRFGTGFYVFNSWDDFVNGAKPKNYGITFSNTPGYAQAYPSFQFNQYTFYLQDNIKFSNRFNFTGGIRFDLPTYPDTPQKHPLIENLSFEGRKYSTSALPKQRIMISPRVGFNYDILGDKSIVARGGTGIFTGRIPFVWIVSQVGDAGMLQTTMQYSGADVPGPFNPDPRAYLPATQPEAGTIIPTGGFTIMDPDFKMPSTWKSSLAFDFKLPYAFKASVEGVLNKDINAVRAYKDGLNPGTPMNIPGYPDHRIMYPYAYADKYMVNLSSAGKLDPTGTYGATPLYVTNADNKDNGYYSSLTFKVEKDMWNNLSGMVAYTRSWAKSLHDGAGDQMSSMWNLYTTVNGANTPELGYSGFVMPNNLIASLSYRYQGFSTSLFYNGGNGGRGSYVYSSNIVGDGGGSTSTLLYVPKDPSEIKFVDQTVNGVVWTAQEQSDAFFKYIDQDKYLKTRKGQYAERNGLIYPWTHHFDVKFTQDFDFKVAGKKNTLQLGLDIVNVGNLLNSNWGNNWSAYQTSLLVFTNASAVKPDGTVIPTFRLNPIAGSNEVVKETFRKTIGYTSTYYMQFSVRYIFN
ncbi:cell envelope biogenesis protein OmpA [Bacteroidia bacterium]|nr:cell envelope biogenesis protein OmpA [Bacteroidia bacterium]